MVVLYPRDYPSKPDFLYYLIHFRGAIVAVELLMFRGALVAADVQTVNCILLSLPDGLL